MLGLVAKLQPLRSPLQDVSKAPPEVASGGSEGGGGDIRGFWGGGRGGDGNGDRYGDGDDRDGDTGPVPLSEGGGVIADGLPVGPTGGRVHMSGVGSNS